jgi:hypothetical protein
VTWCAGWSGSVRESSAETYRQPRKPEVEVVLSSCSKTAKILASGFEKRRGYELVLATEVLVQGPSRHRGIFENGINTDSHPLDSGESLGGCQEAFPGSGFGVGAHGVTFYRRA